MVNFEKGVYGVVNLRNYITDTKGSYFDRVAGKLELLTQEGFGITRAGDHSWAIAVNDDAGKRSVVCMGCEVRSVDLLADGMADSDIPDARTLVLCRK
jgi:hypothetical protein